MRNFVISLVSIFALSLYGCSGEDTTAANNEAEQVEEETVEISQAETMEEIWASSLDPAEKARRVQELLARSGN